MAASLKTVVVFYEREPIIGQCEIDAAERSFRPIVMKQPRFYDPGSYSRFPPLLGEPDEIILETAPLYWCVASSNGEVDYLASLEEGRDE